MKEENLYKLYASTIQEEQYFLQAHQERIAFYSGLITAILAGITAGFLQATEWYHFAILSIGPILLILISANAIDGSFRMYQRFIEAITVRAKIEQLLGLTKILESDEFPSDFYWLTESLIPIRHVESRKNYETSTSFINKLSNEGYHGITSRLFHGTRWVSFLLLLFFIAISIWTALS